jgi:hypothetical protein
MCEVEGNITEGTREYVERIRRSTSKIGISHWYEFILWPISDNKTIKSPQMPNPKCISWVCKENRF